eukprot:TRINITY_DN7217_c0_g2_i2.p1 TRINITY_DN7217_c0_g2~~TRINITY_DN7217_c0_g2_i2.p1  ORF type:complete len:248 (+),score=63.89 TRINITY_DN7217_c0_g2_i2:129-872(+)
MLRSLVGSEMCIRDRYQRRVRGASVTAVMKHHTLNPEGSWPLHTQVPMPVRISAMPTPAADPPAVNMRLVRELRWSAYSALEARQWELADMLYTKAISLTPTIFHLRRERWEARIHGGHPAAAMEDATAMVALNKGAATGHACAGTSHEILGDYSAAYSSYVRAWELNPTDPCTLGAVERLKGLREGQPAALRSLKMFHGPGVDLRGDDSGRRIEATKKAMYFHNDILANEMHTQSFADTNAERLTV